MSLKSAIAQLEATVITHFDFDGDDTYITLEDGRCIGPLMEDALDDIEEGVTYYWCDALRFSGHCEVVAEDELEDCL